MYGIFTYIYHKNQPNVGKYTIHGSYGSPNELGNRACCSSDDTGEDTTPMEALERRGVGDWGRCEESHDEVG